MPNIGELRKGAVPDPLDERDFTLSFAAPPPTPIDWAAGSDLSAPRSIDQYRSDCCVACAWSYYHWQLRNQEFSRRDLFSRIALPPGSGSYIRDGGLAIVNQGQASATAVPDPVLEDEVNMRDRTGVTPEGELPWKEYSSFSTPSDIESVVRSIQLYRGVVAGVYGTNQGWQALDIPEPPTSDQMGVVDQLLRNGTVWGHALYLFDFHIHNNADGSTEPCVITATSWAGVNQHHLRRRYFSSGAIFNPWTLIPAATAASLKQNVSLNFQV